MMMPGNIRIMIVDDIPQVRRGLIDVLRLATKNILPKIEMIGEAQNGREAIDLAARLQPDVILMDLEMPVMNGYEATRQIKAQYPHIRVIVLTIHGGVEERERAQAAGADEFILKGNGYEILLTAILSIKETNNLRNGGINED